ncbi:hypothetical protein GPECTOR_2g1009 [Gonium pectorale]|uniref:Uncharacterized protein n=1 Tax=Gonium pectorale TaxID=33097 RepID=A0A150H1L6_GONPE|nr:hypothetical protein GPECTOR_2g1009 [Gonium pectorale]|eukprot:KXZ55460.1 hypothetical protein GPECTOR_2g1009 [Gonium pectorale]
MASGDETVGDVVMTDRDQPSTQALQRTASGLKRLHTGEMKRASDAADNDTADTGNAADQLPEIIASGAKATSGDQPQQGAAAEAEQATVPTETEAKEPSAPGGSAPLPTDVTTTITAKRPQSETVGLEDPTAAGTSTDAAEAGNSGPATEPADPSAVAPYPHSTAAATAGGTTIGGTQPVATEAAVDKASEGGATAAAEAEAPPSETRGAKEGALDNVTGPQEGGQGDRHPADVSAGGGDDRSKETEFQAAMEGVVAGKAGATGESRGPTAATLPTTDAPPPDMSSTEAFPPVSTEAQEAGEAIAKAETAPEAGESFADKAST